MKMFLLLLFLPIFALADDDNVKFIKNQRVKFPVPKFYSKVCTGFGKISSYELNASSGKVEILYTIETERKRGDDCPLFFVASEDALEAAD